MIDISQSTRLNVIIRIHIRVGICIIRCAGAHIIVIIVIRHSTRLNIIICIHIRVSVRTVHRRSVNIRIRIITRRCVIIIVIYRTTVNIIIRIHIGIGIRRGRSRSVRAESQGLHPLSQKSDNGAGDHGKVSRKPDNGLQGNKLAVVRGKA